MASEPNISTVWEANRGRSQSPPVFATIAVTYGLRIQAYRLPFICDWKLMILRATSEFICWILPSTYKALPHAVASKASARFNSLKAQVREAKAVGHRAAFAKLVSHWLRGPCYGISFGQGRFELQGKSLGRSQRALRESLT